MRSHLLSFGICCAVPNLLWWNGVAFSQAPACESGASTMDSSDAAAFDFILAGMKKERYKLLSGVCRFTGALVAQIDARPEENLNGPVEGLLAVDAGKTRYDMTRAGWVVDPKSVQLTKGTNKATATTMKGTLTTMYADDGTQATFYHSDNSSIRIAPSKDFPNPQISNFADIRGITLYSDSDQALGLTLEQVFDELVAFFRFQGRVAKCDESAYIVTWQRAVGKAPNIQHQKWSLTVDVDSGFTPRIYRFECASDEKMKKQNPWTLVSENRTDWKRIHEVWVPLRHESSHLRNPYGYGRGYEKTTFEFQWESVNEPVDADLFTYKTFKVSDRVGVQGPSGWIRQPKIPEVNKEQPPLKPRSFWAVIIVNAILAIFLIVLFIIWRIRKRMAPGKSP